MSSLIGPVAVERDAEGWWTHPDIPEFEEGDEYAYKAWLKAQGLETRYTTLEYEDDTHPSYIDYYENNGIDVSEWHPSPPEGDNWFTLSIHDSEDGPVFVWARLSRSPYWRPAMSEIVNRRKYLEAAKALAKTNSPTEEHIQEAILTLQHVINDMTDGDFKLAIMELGEDGKLKLAGDDK